jgi:indolepyruvate ferredoxin oxidoreductase beta subunit
MSEGRFSVLMVGVGGQGILTAARILGEAAHASGREVVVGQLHGLSQRGGSVECSVILGSSGSSYVSGADLVVGFEPLETLRAIPRIDHDTSVLVNLGRLVPPSMVRERVEYPSVDAIVGRIRSVAGEVTAVDGTGVVEDIGDVRVLNVFLIGVLAGLGWIPLEDSRLRESVARCCRPAKLSANFKAYDLGRSTTSC